MKHSLILLAIPFIFALVVALPACDQAATPGTQAPSPAPSRPAPVPTATLEPAPTATTTPVSAAAPSLTPHISPIPTPTPSFTPPWERYLDDRSVSGVTFDAEGNTWIGTGQGVTVRTADGQWETIQAADSGLADDMVYALARDSAGNLWFDTDGGLCVRTPAGTWTTYPDRRAAIEAHYADILQSRSQSPLWAVDEKHQVVWIASEPSRSPHAENQELWAYDGRQWSEQPLGDDFQVKCLAVDTVGNVWASDDRWHLRVLWHGGGWHAATRATTGIHSNYIVAVAADRAGNVWAGSFEWGFTVRQPTGRWQAYTTLNAGLPESSVVAIHVDEQDNVWGLTTGGVSVRWADGAWTTLPFLPSQGIESHPHPHLLSWHEKETTGYAGIITDPMGGVWAWGVEGLFHLPAEAVARAQHDPLPTPTPPDLPASLPNPPERKVLADGIRFVDAWEHDGGEFRINWDWSAYGLAFVHENAIWVAREPQFERQLVTLSPSTQPVALTWSPDGERIAFITGGRLPLDYRSGFVVPADGSDVPTLLGVEWRWIEWWTNARMIYYRVHVLSDLEQLYRVDVETGEWKMISEDGYWYYQSPREDYILVNNRWGANWLLDLEGHDLGHVRGSGEGHGADDWAADGDRFLFSQWERVEIDMGSGWGRPELWVWDVPRRQGHRVFPNAWAGGWSPDDRHIACWVAGTPVRDDAGRITGTDCTFGQPTTRHLGLIEAETGLVKTLIPVEENTTDFPSPSKFWMPDGSHLVYPDGQGDWWLLPMSTLEPRRLTEALAGEYILDRPITRPGATSPNGAYQTWLDTDGDWWLLETATLQVRRLTRGLRAITDDRNALVWSPDSHYLALITPARILILEP